MFVKNEKGQALVETAAVLPFILLIFMAIVDVSIVLGHHIVITNASREAARLAAVGSSNSTITDSINNSTSSLDSTKLVVTITPKEEERSSGNPVTVRLDYNTKFVTPLISAFYSNTLNVNSITTMRME